MSGIYDIIVIGAGSGGLNIAVFMNKIGLRTLLVEKSDSNIGGDCLNFGCVPSKALIHVSKLINSAKKSEQFGLKVNGSVDINRVVKYIKEKQGIIREHENADYFRRQGLEVILGIAKFESENSIKVGGKVFQGEKIVICTGSRPKKLKIPGVEKVNLYTNETIFDLKELPKTLLVIGGGPIGIEIGQAERHNALLPNSKLVFFNGTHMTVFSDVSEISTEVNNFLRENENT